MEAEPRNERTSTDAVHFVHHILQMLLNAGLPHGTNPVYPTSNNIRVFAGRGAGESGFLQKAGSPAFSPCPLLLRMAFSWSILPRYDRGFYVPAFDRIQLIR